MCSPLALNWGLFDFDRKRLENNPMAVEEFRAAFVPTFLYHSNHAPPRALGDKERLQLHSARVN
jgi:hypothetical protein